MKKLITKGMRVSDLLKAYPEALEVLVRFHDHFKMLRRAPLRKTLTKLVTLEQAARIAGIDPQALLLALNEAVGLKEEYLRSLPVAEKAPLLRQSLQPSSSERPAALQTLSSEQEVFLDVRPEIERGEEPFVRIMSAARGLKEDQVLHLVNVFEPIPLYSVLGEKGFTHWTMFDGEAYHIYFYSEVQSPKSKVRHETASVSSELDQGFTPSQPDRRCNVQLVIDVRGLEPPEPMIRILEALPQITPGSTLLVHHHREPLLLYEKLDSQGFAHRVEKVAEDYYRIWITRAMSNEQ